jgi:hypothetical protein
MGSVLYLKNHDSMLDTILYLYYHTAFIFLGFWVFHHTHTQYVEEGVVNEK